jgi:low affinity Fe/Cu permease
MPNVKDVFARIAEKAAQATGSFWAFGIAMMVIVVWAITGPIFGFSDTWQLLINTGTTIITFLMVFLIQHAQNKENRALQLKLNELIAAMEGASNRLIDVEDLDEHELDNLYRMFKRLASSAKRLDPGAHMSVDDPRWEEADKAAEHRQKLIGRKGRARSDAA